uniref:Uncharacterized protein n=1 Tax=Schlesneria paludicola TaxID=360056 RepID=A0A7C4QQI3_9PLAN
MKQSMDRREFARRVSCGAAAAALSETWQAAAAAPPSAPPAADTSPPRPADAAPSKGPPAPLLVLARLMEDYPSDQYTPPVLEGILQDIRTDLARGRELSAFPLANGDQPAFLFPGAPGCRLVSPSFPLTSR